MLDDIFVPTASPGATTKQIANAEFVGSAIGSAIASALATSQVEFFSGMILTAVAQDYRIVEFMPYTATLTSFVAKTSAGTAAGTLKINAATVTGGTMTCAVAQASTALTTANLMTAGNALVLTLSSVSSALNMSFVVVYNRTLTP